MNTDDGSFLSRWSRRKVEATRGPVDEPASALPEAQPELAASQLGESERSVAVAVDQAPVADPPPTLADVALLSRNSDFSRFVAPGVDEGVKQAAMKKLFSDPHFNLMDGLDTYIDDYGKPDPIPIAMLRRMSQSATLKLFEHEHEDPEKVEPQPPRLAEATTAGPDLTPHNDDADLQLQQDDAARRPESDQGTGA